VDGFFGWLRKILVASSDVSREGWAGIGADLEGKLDLLIRSSWGPRDDNQTRSFIFDDRIVPAGGNEVFTAALLKHVRFVALRLSVPFMNPRIEVSQLPTACGQFVEEDGWVKLHE